MITLFYVPINDSITDFRNSLRPSGPKITAETFIIGDVSRLVVVVVTVALIADFRHKSRRDSSSSILALSIAGGSPSHLRPERELYRCCRRCRVAYRISTWDALGRTTCNCLRLPRSRPHPRVLIGIA